MNFFCSVREPITGGAGGKPNAIHAFQLWNFAHEQCLPSFISGNDGHFSAEMVPDPLVR